MTFEDVKKSKLEETIQFVAGAVLVLSGIICLGHIVSGCGDTHSYSSSRQLEGWLQIGRGLGVFAAGFISWALLRAVAEILVLLKGEGDEMKSESAG